MSEGHIHYGVHIGWDNHGAVASGSGPRAEYHAAPGAELTAVVRALAELHVLVLRHPTEVTEPELVLRDLRRIEAEVAEQRPDRAALSDAVDRLLRRAAAGGSVFAAVQQLGDLLNNL